jgi:hypothetical protein
VKYYRGKFFAPLQRSHVHHKIGAILHPVSCARRSNESSSEQDENTKDSRIREDMQNKEDREVEISIRYGERIHQPKDGFGFRMRRYKQNAQNNSKTSVGIFIDPYT